MLTLNLLPEQSKLEYAFDQKRRLIVFVLIILCGIIFVFDALLASEYFYVRVVRVAATAELEKQNAEEGTKHIAQIEKDVKSANAVIMALSSVRKESSVAGPILEKIALLVKPGVYLKSLSLNASDGAVSMSGFAKTREAVLDLESMLNQSDVVVSGSVSSPVTNIFTSKDINFSFQFKVKNHL